MGFIVGVCVCGGGWEEAAVGDSTRSHTYFLLLFPSISGFPSFSYSENSPDRDGVFILTECIKLIHSRLFMSALNVFFSSFRFIVGSPFYISHNAERH